MAKSKQAAPPPPPPAPANVALARLAALSRLGGTRGRLVIGLVIAIGIIAGLRAAWDRWGEPSLADKAYQLTADEIIVTPQPAWIHGDVKAEVIRDARLTDLNLRDRQLLDKLTRAFALHSWVAEVKRVEKAYPARVTIDLVYRQPVAMVEIRSGEKPGLLFIDAQSVVLPSEDFAVAQTREFLRISAGDVLPTGVYGTEWGSRRILGAAQVAAAWGDRWKPLGLYRIVVKEDPNAEPVYELHTRGEGRAIWGRAPGDEAPGEPSAEEKIAHLTQVVKQHGPLDQSASPRPIDLRHPSAPTRPTQTADGSENGTSVR